MVKKCSLGKNSLEKTLLATVELYSILLFKGTVQHFIYISFFTFFFPLIPDFRFL